MMAEFSFWLNYPVKASSDAIEEPFWFPKEHFIKESYFICVKSIIKNFCVMEMLHWINVLHGTIDTNKVVSVVYSLSVSCINKI